jgi:long-chain acyl-CoA synthetase
MKALLGGKVKAMVSGSAPIEQNVLQFLKVVFCCPIVEAYGLSETSGGATVVDVDDNIGGHVGGPIECIKMRLKDLPEM